MKNDPLEEQLAVLLAEALEQTPDDAKLDDLILAHEGGEELPEGAIDHTIDERQFRAPPGEPGSCPFCARSMKPGEIVFRDFYQVMEVTTQGRLLEE